MSGLKKYIYDLLDRNMKSQQEYYCLEKKLLGFTYVVLVGKFNQFSESAATNAVFRYSYFFQEHDFFQETFFNLFVKPTSADLQSLTNLVARLNRFTQTHSPSPSPVSMLIKK